MITANEAYKKTKNNIDNFSTTQLSEIEDNILYAISEGKYSISCDGVLRSESKKALEDNGYKVEIGSQYNESYYIISWKGKW